MEAIIFCGIQASGKTTFFKENFFQRYVRISLDLLKTRNREDKFLELCFQIQQRFVVDNTNPTKAERAKYISQAKEHKFKVIGYYFQSKLVESLERNNQRISKDNIKEVGIKSTYKRLELPSLGEGFDELYYVAIENSQFIIKEFVDEI
jgi:predicted kinase